MLAPVIQPRAVRGKKGNYVGHIRRLPNTFECLHFEREATAHIRLGKVGHIRLDHARSHRILHEFRVDEDRAPVPDQGVNRTLCSCIGRKRWRAGLARIPGTACAAREETRTIFDPSLRATKGPLRGERTADVCREEVVEIFYRVVFDGRGL